MRSIFAIALAAALTAQIAAAAAQVTIRNRSVRIIEGDPPASEPAAPVVVTPPVLPEGEQRANNPSGIRLELLPGTEVALGSAMSIRVTTEKPGYLIVVDVDSSGALTQIFPNPYFLASPKGAPENANYIARGKPQTIPDPKEKSNFRFVAAEPRGVGMLVAILSDKPVQVIDLPDVPAVLAGKLPAVQYVQDNTRTLKVLSSSDTGPIQDAKWSFATMFYVIK